MLLPAEVLPAVEVTSKHWCRDNKPINMFIIVYSSFIILNYEFLYSLILCIELCMYYLVNFFSIPSVQTKQKKLTYSHRILQIITKFSIQLELAKPITPHPNGEPLLKWLLTFTFFPSLQQFFLLSQSGLPTAMLVLLLPRQVPSQFTK